MYVCDLILLHYALWLVRKNLTPFSQPIRRRSVIWLFLAQLGHFSSSARLRGEKRNYKMVQNGCYGRLLTIISWAPELPWVWSFAMLVPLKVSLTFKRDDHIWKVTWPEYKNPINSNSVQVILIKTMPTVKEPSEAKSVAWICRNLHKLKSCDVIKVLWRHNFFNNVNLNKSMLQILLPKSL